MLLFFTVFRLLEHVLRLNENPVPVIEVPFRPGGARNVEIGKYIGRVGTAQDRHKPISLHQVGEEHRRRVALPDLYRVNAELAMVIIHIEKDLGCLPDAGDRLEGMPVPQDNEIGDRVQLEKVRACNDEKIADHKVGGPGQEQVRQAVEHVKDIAPFLPYDVVDLGGKGLETDVRVELVNDYLPARFDDRGVLGEAHVYDAPPFCKGFLYVGVGESPVIVDIVDLKNDIVAHLQVIECFIEAMDPCADPGTRLHNSPPDIAGTAFAL